MDDPEFLSYCDDGLHTPRCSLTSDQVTRLYRLAGGESSYSYPPGAILNCDPEEIRVLVRLARDRLAA